jgi:hypothetical protein
MFECGGKAKRRHRFFLQARNHISPLLPIQKRRRRFALPAHSIRIPARARAPRWEYTARLRLLPSETGGTLDAHFGSWRMNSVKQHSQSRFSHAGATNLTPGTTPPTTRRNYGHRIQ